MEHLLNRVVDKLDLILAAQQKMDQRQDKTERRLDQMKKMMDEKFGEILLKKETAVAKVTLFGKVTTNKTISVGRRGRAREWEE